MKDLKMKQKNQKNIEVKAMSTKDKNDFAREKLVEWGRVKPIGIDHQIDTYFCSNFGRCKLREGDIENCLVMYNRADQSGPKLSNVSLTQLEKNQTKDIKKVLSEAMGLKAIVDKEREIWKLVLNQNDPESFYLKFHLDDVDALGYFIEIEVIDRDGVMDKEYMESYCKFWMSKFNIDEKDLVDKSYSDLIMGPLWAKNND